MLTGAWLASVVASVGVVAGIALADCPVGIALPDRPACLAVGIAPADCPADWEDIGPFAVPLLPCIVWMSGEGPQCIHHLGAGVEGLDSYLQNELH